MRKLKSGGRMNIKVGRGVVLEGAFMELGSTYYIQSGRKFIECKLIQVTPFGYNLLNIEKNRCVLKRHLYVPIKLREKYKDDKKFFYKPEGLGIFEDV